MIMKKILIVDDDEGIRESCKNALARKKYIIETAKNPIEALELLDDTFNLVITDLRMPEYDGIWLANEIKNIYSGKIPVILMSGTKSNIKIYIKKEFGIVAILLKPFYLNELLTIVSEKIGPADCNAPKKTKET